MKNLLTTSLASLASFALAAFVLSGCADSTPTNPESSTSATEHGEHHAGDGYDHGEHAHPDKGPHGGDLIELGNEEYHAELVHPHAHDDDAHAHADGHEDHKNGPQATEQEQVGDHDHAGFTVYILDSSSRTPVAIDATEIALNLSHEGQPEQFKLAAMPAKEDPEGKSSRFASDDKDLLEHFHAEEIEGTLVVTIDGKSYRGRMTHGHEHDDHGHEDHGHEHHGHEH